MASPLWHAMGSWGGQDLSGLQMVSLSLPAVASSCVDESLKPVRVRNKPSDTAGLAPRQVTTATLALPHNRGLIRRWGYHGTPVRRASSAIPSDNHDPGATPIGSAPELHGPTRSGAGSSEGASLVIGL